MKLNKATSFSFYFLFYTALAAYYPYLVLYYQQLKFSGAQIGLLTGMAPLITLLFAPLWTGVADRTRQHRLVISITIALAALLAALFPFLTAFSAVAILIGLYSLFSAPIISLSDSATMHMLAGEKAFYGRVRVGGTIGWGLAAPFVGLLIQTYGLKLAFWGYALLMFPVLLVAQGLTFSQSSTPGSFHGNIRLLLGNRRWILFLVMAFVGGIGFNSINTYLFAYMAEFNASKTTMGLAVAISTISELPVLFFANYLIKRLKAHGLLVLSLAVTGVRLLLYAAFNFTAGVLVFQLLNGLTFPAAWVAGVSYADENAPPGMNATAQGMFGAMVSGIGAAAAGFFGGILLESIGGRGMYLVFGILLLGSLVILTIIERRKD